MGKRKVTDETLMIACRSNDCCYNERNFCKLQEIMIDSSGCCIYKDIKSSGSWPKKTEG